MKGNGVGHVCFICFYFVLAAQPRSSRFKLPTILTGSFSFPFLRISAFKFLFHVNIKAGITIFLLALAASLAYR